MLRRVRSSGAFASATTPTSLRQLPTASWHLCRCAGDATYVFSLPDYRQKARIQVGHFPHRFALRPDGKVMFLSNWLSDAVSAIDVVGKKVLANVKFARGSGPKRILVVSRRSKRSQGPE